MFKKAVFGIAAVILALAVIAAAHFLIGQSENPNPSDAIRLQSSAATSETAGSTAGDAQPAAAPSMTEAASSSGPRETAAASTTAAPDTAVSDVTSTETAATTSETTPATTQSQNTAQTTKATTRKSETTAKPAYTEATKDKDGYLYTKEEAIANFAAEWKRLTAENNFNVTYALEVAKESSNFSQEEFDANVQKMLTDPYSSQSLTEFFEDYRRTGNLGVLVAQCSIWLGSGGDDAIVRDRVN